MSEQTAETVEATEQPESETPPPAQLPDDHPLVKTLAEQKRAIRDLKAKAARLDQIEEAQKSEVERAAERAAEAEAERDAARAEVIRFRVAAKYGISDADAELFLTAKDEETLTQQAKRLADRDEDAGRPRTPRPDRNQGRDSRAQTTTADQFAASIDGLL